MLEFELPINLVIGSEFQGLYIHVPFCSSRCSYCDFATDLENTGERELYLACLLDELTKFGHLPLALNTIYFGGGTPSILGPVGIQYILDAIRKLWKISENSEITLEANPETITRDVVRDYLVGGVNRFSVGIQSFNDDELKYLGRKHLTSHNFEAMQILKESGVRFNADLMLGIPLQTERSLQANIDALFDFGVKHVSAYMLSIEEDAPWYEAVQSGKIPLRSEVQTTKLYRACLSKLESRGLRRYEISAFAIPGQECRHNLKYWKNEDYLGVGPSAGSYLSGYRFQNKHTLKTWVSQIKNKESYEIFEYIHSKNAILDTIMLRFRLSEGLEASQLMRWCEEFPELELNSRMDRLEARGLVKKTSMSYRLSKKGFLFANEVFLEFLE